MTRARTFVAALLIAVTTSGCYGGWHLTRTIHGWNGRATNNKFVNSALTWALIIIPVYGVATVADFLVFNTIEFWTGNNPIALGPDGSARLTHQGREYQYRSVGPDQVEVYHQDVLALRYRKQDGRIVVEDGQGRRLGEMTEQAAHARAARSATVF